MLTERLANNQDYGLGMIMNSADDERARAKVTRRRLFLTEVASFL
ncbi:hypothetical protein [Bartonella apis]|nr:hypothetical protein [Bartonella apis]